MPAAIKTGATAKVRLARSLRFVRTRTRELLMIGKALASTKHPILVHIIPDAPLQSGLRLLQ